MFRRTLALAWPALLMLLQPQLAYSEDKDGGEASTWSWQRLIMPGDLARAHAHLSEDCSSCHSTSGPERESARCLACHEKVANDLQKVMDEISRDEVSDEVEMDEEAIEKLRALGYIQ